ncbi:MAG: preprotein translocase subunit SecG [Synergistaceae bacterium]|nr:preprotein translocase subunit SecG [Synergistaceae bacterium]
MKTFLSLIHFVLCIMVMVIVLLQRRKQGGFGGAFGGGTQADSGQWQRFTGLTKLTIVLFALFMLTSVFLTFILA